MDFSSTESVPYFLINGQFWPPFGNWMQKLNATILQSWIQPKTAEHVHILYNYFSITFRSKDATLL